MSESTQKKIGTTRAPRVQLTYDVETGGAVTAKELPFVVGVMGDFCPQGPTAEKTLKQRSFVQIDQSSFKKVMSSMKPTLNLSVQNKLDNDGSQMKVNLAFSDMDDFTPEGIVKSTPALAKLIQTREKLNDLLAKLEGNEKLNDLLAEVVLNTEVREKANAQLQKTKGDKDKLAKAGAV